MNNRWTPEWRELLIGAVAGFAAQEFFLRRNVRRFVESVEQGDMEAAERYADRAYLSNLLLWVRHRLDRAELTDDDADSG